MIAALVSTLLTLSKVLRAQGHCVHQQHPQGPGSAVVNGMLLLISHVRVLT
jgi:hypothetical protein